MYCTVEDVRRRNPLILSIEGIDDEGITLAVEYASSVVDSILGKRYKVPMEPSLAIIRGIVADLAAADCIGNIAGSDGDDREPARAVELREKAMDLMDRLNGEDMGISPSADNSEAGRKAVSTTYLRPRHFDRWDPSDHQPEGRG